MRVITNKVMRHSLLMATISYVSLGVATASAAKDTVELDDVVVSVSRYEQNVMEVAANTTTVTRKDIEEMGARTLLEALRAVPGLQIGTQGNAFPHISVRGFRDTKDLTVLINGIPFRHVDGSADLTMLPLNIVERIEFVKGPGSAIWGRGAVGGTLSIFTTPAKTDEQSLDVALSAGSFNTYEGSARGLLPWENGYALVSMDRGTTDGFQDDTGKQTANALIQIHQDFNEMFTLDGQYLHSYVDASRGSTIPLVNGQPMAGVDITDNFAIDGAKFHGVYNALTLSPKVKLRSDLTVENALTLVKYDHFETGGNTITPTSRSKGFWQSDIQEQGIMNDLHVTWDREFNNFHNTMVGGLYYEYGDFENTKPSLTGAPSFGPPDWSTPSNGNPATGIKTGQYVIDTTEETMSVYLQDRVEVGPFGFQAGARFDQIKTDLSQSNKSIDASQTESRVSPRVAADWRFYNTDDTSLMAFVSYTEGFQSQLPKLSTSGGVTLAQLVEPEVTRAKEIGIKGTALGGDLYGQFSIYRTNKFGPRSYRTSPNDFLFTNAKTQVEGVEGEVQYAVTPDFDVYAHYAYQDAFYRNFTNGSGSQDYSGNRVRMTPEHMFGFGGTYRWDDFTFNMTANYTGERNLRDNLTDKSKLHSLDPYWVVNTSVSYKYENLTAQFVANNIFDEFYIADDFSSNDAGCAGDPRSFALILRASF